MFSGLNSIASVSSPACRMVRIFFQAVNVPHNFFKLSLVEHNAYRSYLLFDVGCFLLGSFDVDGVHLYVLAYRSTLHP